MVGNSLGPQSTGLQTFLSILFVREAPCSCSSPISHCDGLPSTVWGLLPYSVNYECHGVFFLLSFFSMVLVYETIWKHDVILNSSLDDILWNIRFIYQWKQDYNHLITFYDFVCIHYYIQYIPMYDLALERYFLFIIYNCYLYMLKLCFCSFICILIFCYSIYFSPYLFYFIFCSFLFFSSLSFSFFKLWMWK